MLCLREVAQGVLVDLEFGQEVALHEDEHCAADELLDVVVQSVEGPPLQLDDTGQLKADHLPRGIVITAMSSTGPEALL